jgi:D-alanyl-D-alanine carboxypeptidase
MALAFALAGCAADAHVQIDSPPQVEASLPADTIQQLQDAVTAAMTATGSSGAIVGVWAPWSGTWVAGLGTETPGGSDPVSADDVFRAGQVTRAMTCDVLYRVAADGTVGLDDSVSQWVSGVPDLTGVTLRQLCDSTSGIGSYTGVLQNQFLTNPARVWNPRELASFGLGQPRSAEPGASWRESDAGYLLLGLALERATGKSAAELLRQHVFDPLDLTVTTLPGGQAAKPSTTGASLEGYHSLRGGDGVMNCTAPLDITTLSASTGFTDSGVVTDIDDLGRYAQALAAGSLLPEGTDRLADARPPRDGAPSWFTTGGGVYRAGSLVGQYGAVPGYLTAAFADPASGLTVAVVLNNSAAGGGVAAALGWELAAIASKAPAAAGQTAPAAGLPWTAEQFGAEVASAAICAAP